MNCAVFRFYAELNDLLPRQRRYSTFEYTFTGTPAIKDAIEALGVPHTEVDLILVNSVLVDFGYRIKHDDRVSVYPEFRRIELAPATRLFPKPPREPRFVLDVHLGRLAAYLRMLGFDATYRNDFGDERLARMSRLEDRTLLTRDRGLLKRSEVTRGYYLRATQPREQLREVVRRFDLGRSIRPFLRCMHCNTILEPVEKDEIRHRLLRETERSFTSFKICPGCNRLYWRGSHYERMQRLIDRVINGD